MVAKVSGNTSYFVFIDYDNLSDQQKNAGILNIVTKVLIQLPLNGNAVRAKCDVRVYGGWYEGTTITQSAQKVTTEIQQDFPTIIRLPTSQGIYRKVSLNAELAVSLLQEPGHHLFNTFRRRRKPGNVRVESPTVAGCTQQNCILPLTKKLLENGKCSVSNCVTTGDLVYRHEQKIVDTMLSCDLIYASNIGVEYIVLVSGDDDFLPPLRTILLQGTSAARFHTKSGDQLASFPIGGAALFERDL